MARVKRAASRPTRRNNKKVIKAAKGYYGAAKYHPVCSQAGRWRKAGQYAYRDP